MSRRKIQISELDLAKIGDRICFIRLNAGLTQDQFAEITGLTKSNISGLENHKYEPSYRAITKMVKLFNVSSDWILFGIPPTDNDKITDDKVITVITGPNTMNRFKDTEKARAIYENLMELEMVDPDGYDEIHRIIKMKLDIKSISKKKQIQSSGTTGSSVE